MTFNPLKRSIAAAAPILFALLAASTLSTAASDPTHKKLIEYGWDVPTPGEMETNLASMEKHPFDGLIFRLAGGHNAFATNLLEPGNFNEDTRILSHLKFTRFTDNFVLIWGSPPVGFDWFDDNQHIDKYAACRRSSRRSVSIGLTTTNGASSKRTRNS